MINDDPRISKGNINAFNPVGVDKVDLAYQRMSGEYKPVISFSAIAVTPGYPDVSVLQKICTPLMERLSFQNLGPAVTIRLIPDLVHITVQIDTEVQLHPIDHLSGAHFIDGHPLHVAFL